VRFVRVARFAALARVIVDRFAALART